MTGWSDETRARIEARLHTIPAGVTECCQPCADIRAALVEIKHFHTVHKWCHRQPTHGKCCTCQACGLDYDSCRCSLDEQVERAEAAEKRVEELERSGGSLARALDGTRYAMKERAEWVKASRGVKP